MATARRDRTALPEPASRLVEALSSCATEADLAQVLYAELHPAFGYNNVVLHVLEREGWYHAVIVDNGVLQDIRRRRLSESQFVGYYDERKSLVFQVTEEAAKTIRYGRGPGRTHGPETLIWVPIIHRDEPIGSVSYQLFERREVPAEEIALLEEVHANLGVLLSNAYLNELTRNQALSLGALNAIARALSATHDEDGVVRALATELRSLMPSDVVELVVPDERASHWFRALRAVHGRRPTRTRVSRRSRRFATATRIFTTGQPELESHGDDAEHRSSVWVPLLEGGRVRAVLSTHCRQADVYEQSTLTFLQQVADQVALALRNAWSYSAIEAQSRRLEVVNVVGRRLASSLDRWAIVRTLREELARHLEFDLFSVATVTETPEGPVAEAYVYDSGEEQSLAPVPLASAGPSREAYETGRPVLIRRSPWARSLESSPLAGGDRVVGPGVVLDVTRPGHHRRVAARSIIWVPVSHGDQVTALLSVQSYQSEMFDDWHVQLLHDVAAHVGLALANADHFHAAQTERKRLEALHLLELGVAGAGDEAQIAEAVVGAVRTFLEAPLLMLMYLDGQGRLTGYCSEEGRDTRVLPPVSVEVTRFFKHMMNDGATIAEAVPAELRQPRPHQAWPTWGPHIPAQFLAVPLFNGDRVVGALSAQRLEDVPFTHEEIQLLESAAPVVGIALRTVRLHRANEMALAHSVRIQEVAALAGHELAGVLANVAEQARTMLEAGGAACWAFDDDGRVTAQASRGGGGAARVLRWSGRTPARTWRTPPEGPAMGANGSAAWTLIPLRYADRLVGALGSVHVRSAIERPLGAVADFARHAAIAIENARLVAETRGRIHTLEAVANFAHLDITRPARARAEMCRLIERALVGSRGALWLLEGSEMVRAPGSGSVTRIDASQPDWWGPALRAGRTGRVSRQLQTLLRSGPVTARDPSPSAVRELGRRGIFATPIEVEGRVVGMLTADATASSPGETRRLMGVLAGQAALVLGRLELVAALDRQARMLHTVLSHSPVGVVLEDAAGNVVFANAEIERLYGVPGETLSGKPARRLLERPDVAAVIDPEAEPDRPLEVRLQDSGTVVQVQRVPIPGSEDQPARVLALHQDVTRERAVLEAKDLMLRAIGHEVRSPAAAMRSTIAGLLQWGPVLGDEQRHGLLAEAYGQSERLLSLVENQLLIAKLETRRFEPVAAPVALGRALEQVLALLRNRYGNRLDVVDTQLPSGLPEAHCEPTHLDQVLTNLIGNALEYTSAHRIRVDALADDGWLEVTVMDDGDGLPPDRLPTLFAKTGPAGQNRARGGLGLGLYLCRLVVERSFGGRIWLERTGSNGTIFKFTVPAAPVRGRRVPRGARVGSSA